MNYHVNERQQQENEKKHWKKCQDFKLLANYFDSQYVCMGIGKATNKK